MLNAGIDWTKPWPQVPSNEKAALYQMVRNSSKLHGKSFIVSVIGPSSDPLYGTVRH